MAVGKGMTFKMVARLVTKEFEKGIGKMKRQLSIFGNFLKGAFTIGSITMFGKAMVDASMEFEDAMARVKSVCNATTEEMQMMTAEARKMGETTRYTATEAAKAMENLVRNGLSAQQATKALSSVLQLAQANAIGLDEAAVILTNTLNMFNLKVEDAARVNDVLSSTAANTATNVSELYDALANAAPVASVLGFNIEEVNAALGALAQRGVKGADAGTQLRMAFVKLTDPAILKKLKEYNLNIDEQTIKADGLAGTFRKLYNAQLSMTQLVDIFSQKGAAGMANLIMAYQQFERVLNITENSMGTTERMFGQSMGNMNQEVKVLKSVWESLLISMGNKTSGIFVGIVRLLQNLINNFKTVGGTIMNLASVAVPFLVKGLTYLIGRWKAAAAAALAAGTTMKIAMGDVIGIVINLATWVGTALVGAYNRSNAALKEANNQLGETKAKWIETKDELKKIYDQLGPDTDENTMAGIVKRLCEMFPEFADIIAESANNTNIEGWKKLKDILGDIAGYQEAIDTAKAQEQVYKANIRKYASNIQNQDLLGIGKQLDKLGFLPEEINAIFNQIAESIVSNNKNYYKAYREIVKLLSDYSVKFDAEALDTWLDIIRNNSVVKTSKRQKQWDRGEKNKYKEEAINAQKGADSAYVDAGLRGFRGLETAFLNIEADNEFYLKKGYLTQEEFEDKMYDALQDFIKKVKDLPTLSQEDGKALQEYQKRYQGAVPGETLDERKARLEKKARLKTENESIAKQNAENLSKVYDKWNKAQSKLNSRLKEHFINQEEYNKELDKLNTEYFKQASSLGTLSIDDIFDKEKGGKTLSSMEKWYKDLYEGSQKAVVNTLLESAANEISKGIDEDIKEADKQFKSKMDEYYKNQKKANEIADKISSSSTPKKSERSTLFDFQKSKGDILSENLDVQKNYVSQIQKYIKDIEDEYDTLGVKSGIVERALAKWREELIKAQSEAKTLEEVMNFEKIKEAVADLEKEVNQTALGGLSNLANGMDRVVRGWSELSEMMQDEDTTGWDMFIGVFNEIIQMMETVSQIFDTIDQLSKLTDTLSGAQLAQLEEENRLYGEQIGLITTLKALKGEETAAEVKDTAAKLTNAAAGKVEASANAQSSIAGAANSGAKLPFPWNLGAIAAGVGAVLAALASMSKFANGGIVGGSSSVGDKNIIRANSGEMILTKGQQSTLFNAIKSGNLGGGGNVQFKIKGTDLIGVINNTNSKMRG